MKKFYLLFLFVMALIMMGMCPQKMWADDYTRVASVTVNGSTTNYTEFHNAVAQATKYGTVSSPATIKMLADCKFLDYDGEKITSGEVILDLNGHTISGKNYVNTDADRYFGALLYVNGGNLTIIDGTSAKYGTITNSQAEAICIDKGTLSIHAGTFKGGEKSGSGLVVNGGGVTLSGGRYTTSSSNVSAVYNNANSSALANKYGFFDAGGNLLEESTDGYIMSSGKYVSDIIVKVVPVKAASLTIDGKTTVCTLEEALEAASAGTLASPATIKMIDDVLLDDDTSLEFLSGVATLDLNGKTISGNYYDNILLIYGDASNLTITDSSEDKFGTIINAAGDAVYCSGAKVTIHAGTFSGGNDDGCGLMAYATELSLDGGHFTTATENYPALVIDSEASALAAGYKFCDTDDNILEDNCKEGIFAYNSTKDYAGDVTVKAIATAIDLVGNAAGLESDSAVYNLAGQRVSAPLKGLYIMNGKKYLMK